MKFSPVRASLLALAIFSMGTAHAATAASDAPLLLAQTEDAGSPEADAVRKFLANAKDMSQLSEDRLQQRLNRAQKLRVEGLPPDLDEALQKEIAQLEAEISRRQQAAEPQPQPPVQEQVETQPKLEEPPLPPDTSGQAQEEAQPQKKKRQKQQDQAQEVQPEQQPQPEQQAEPETQPQPEQQAQPEPQPQPQSEQQVQQATPEAQPQPEASGSADVAAFLQSVRPASELDADQLSQQMSRATELAQAPGISAGQRAALRTVIRETRAAMRGKQAGQQQEASQPATQPPAAEQPVQKPVVQEQVQPPTPSAEQLAKPSNVDPALEQQARALLADNVDVRSLKRKQLRQRLAGMRDLLATNQLSVETREALRQKLASERQVLRNQVAVDEGVPPPQPQVQQPGQPPQQKPGGNAGGSTTTNNSNVIINNTTTNTVNNTTTDVRVVLKDRRPPQQLDDAELVRRIDVYRDVVASEQYDEEQRMMWRQQMEDDRRFLRRRMMEERRQREAELRSGDIGFNIDIEDQYDPRADVPDDVFAAEVEDDEIAGVLAAPPRRAIERRYTVDEIERSPEARNAVARIEIDTVHFGFGEGFLREEEIDKLDRIAQVLEKILAKHPEEVFLIEGHTDAVGSDASNLQLSRQRAAAVKQALTTYYVIPADNLKTVGLGERYLKIPTNQPEAENRRVSLARITPLVGQAD